MNEAEIRRNKTIEYRNESPKLDSIIEHIENVIANSHPAKFYVSVFTADKYKKKVYDHFDKKGYRVITDHFGFKIYWNKPPLTGICRWWTKPW